MNIDEFLSHYGKKGMKWGVRRSRSKQETKIREGRKKILRNRRRLSDIDLKNHIERINNEKKLKDLINEDLKPGRTVAKKILSESGQRVSRTVLTGAALYGVKVAVSRKFGSEPSSFIAPKPKK